MVLAKLSFSLNNSLPFGKTNDFFAGYTNSLTNTFFKAVVINCVNLGKSLTLVLCPSKEQTLKSNIKSSKINNAIEVFFNSLINSTTT